MKRNFWRQLWCTISHAGYIDWGRFRCAYCPYSETFDGQVIWRDEAGEVWP